ncbi:MAG: DUF554 domain-containing protein [Desulfosarcinaceae bacterium]|nr:DUF554 domain-containing protein [Desulfosarcinaceae bacterium]
MLGTWVNGGAIIVGGGVGLLLRGGLPERFKTILLQAVGLAVVLVGLKGALGTDAILVVVISMAVGGLLGEALGIEAALERLGHFVEARFAKGRGSFAKGFVTASLVFCVGSMAILGALESGLTGNHQTLFAKSLLDGIISVVFASTFGVGALFSAISVVVYQGLITLAATALKPFLLEEVVRQMTGVGGLLIMALGLNMLEFPRIRVGNMLPAIFMPLAYALLERLF